MSKRDTTDGKPPRPGYEKAGAPAPINPKTGQHDAYWVLDAEERVKGFVRPLRRAYIHRGERPQYEVFDLTAEQEERFGGYGYVKWEPYPADLPGSVTGRFWTQTQLDSGCGQVTNMGLALCETYARQPGFYGSTFCATCREHFPVAEFRWVEDGKVVGS